MVGRLLRATPASAAARYAEQERGGGQRAPGAQLAAQLSGRAAAAGLQLLPALEARLEAVAAVQVAQHLVVSPLAQQGAARPRPRDGDLLAAGARGGAGPLDLLRGRVRGRGTVRGRVRGRGRGSGSGRVRAGPLDLEELVKGVVGLRGEARVDPVVRLVGVRVGVDPVVRLVGVRVRVDP